MERRGKVTAVLYLKVEKPGKTGQVIKIDNIGDKPC